MPHPRRTAAVAGALYIVTVLTSIPALLLKESALREPAELADPGGATALLWAVLLELVLTAACIGTAVALYPVIRRQSEASAIGFVSARAVEGALILVGIIALLALVAVQRGAASAGAGVQSTVNAGLTAVHDAAFLLGPGLIPAASALLLGSALYRARLVPRIMPILGFVGAPLLVASMVATLFGGIDQVSPIAGLAALPIAAWEISLGVWLVAKGFRPEAITRLDAAPARGLN